MKTNKTKNRAKRKVQIILGSLLLGTLLMSQVNQAEAFVLSGDRWPGSQPSIPYHISTSLQGHVPYDGTFEEAVQAINNAGEEWNTAGGSNASFKYVGLTEVNEVADDGINAIIYKQEQCPGPGASAGVWIHRNGNVIHGFDIVLYSHYGTTGWIIGWSAKPQPYPPDTDITTVVLHEMGHALGIDHSEIYGVVMSISGCPTGCSMPYLYFDDVDAIQAVYGGYYGESFTSSQEMVENGTSFTLEIDYPLAAGKPYVIFMSTSGMEGTPLYIFEPTDSRILGVNQEFFPTETYPDIFENFEGVLDANGRATATVHLPDDTSFLESQDLYFAAVSADCVYLNCFEDVGYGIQVRIRNRRECDHTTSNAMPLAQSSRSSSGVGEGLSFQQPLYSYAEACLSRNRVRIRLEP